MEAKVIALIMNVLKGILLRFLTAHVIHVATGAEKGIWGLGLGALTSPAI